MYFIAVSHEMDIPSAKKIYKNNKVEKNYTLR